MRQFSAIADVKQLKPHRKTPQALAHQALHKYWGYSAFRTGQWEIIQALLQQEDVLAVLPTGSGKSLCFQLPALCQRGLTLVVSPLIALMEDQVSQLQQRGIEAACLHSQLASDQHRQVLRELHHLKLLYLAPETLLSPKVWRQLQRPSIHIAGLVIDEAHCIHQWGESFRPAYDRLGAVRHALLANKPIGSHFPIAAFTATADRPTRQAISHSLKLQAPVSFVRSPKRTNIEINLQRIWTPRQRRQKALAFLQAQCETGSQTGKSIPSGLVYVRRRRDSEALAEQFTAAGFTTAAYHGGLSPRHRRQIEQDWMLGAAKGGLPFVVCTSAFGMGVDLPNCRWILHYHLPLLLSEYIQEIGRAGRDGNTAVALGLASEPSGLFDPSDRQRNRYFLDSLAQQQQRCQAIAQKLPNTGSLQNIRRRYPQDGALALAWLHRQGQLQWSDPFHYQLKPAINGRKSFKSNLLPDTESMQRFKDHKAHFWQFIEAVSL